MNHGQVMHIARDFSIDSLPKPQKNGPESDSYRVTMWLRDVYDIMNPAEIRQWELKKAIEWAMRSISGNEG